MEVDVQCVQNHQLDNVELERKVTSNLWQFYKTVISSDFNENSLSHKDQEHLRVLKGVLFVILIYINVNN